MPRTRHRGAPAPARWLERQASERCIDLDGLDYGKGSCGAPWPPVESSAGGGVGEVGVLVPGAPPLAPGWLVINEGGVQNLFRCCVTDIWPLGRGRVQGVDHDPNLYISVAAALARISLLGEETWCYDCGVQDVLFGSQIDLCRDSAKIVAYLNLPEDREP
nr:unnamed protein product [Digitaria exilis]